MARRPTKATEAKKKSKAVQKQLAPKHTAGPSRSQRPVSFGQISSDEDFRAEIAQEEETEDDSSQTDQPQPQAMDPLFNPALSLRTKDTQDTDKSGRVAYDVDFFFTVVDVEGAMKRVCKLCADEHGYGGVRKGLKNYMYEVKSGKTNCRNHLLKTHSEIYDKTVQEKNWPFRLSTEASGPRVTVGDLRKRAIPRFTLESFREYLVRFIVADDQSIRVIECPEFRDLCMLLRESLQDGDIPHRDRLREAIIDKWYKWFDGLKQELGGAAGRISFTADMWSSGTLISYLALTAHWISGGSGGEPLSLKTALIGFRRMKKRHTGSHIAESILKLLDRAGITAKVGYFTLDNAENNATAMRGLEDLLKNRGTDIKFQHLKNRVRCFPHIINICVSHILASCTRVSKQSLKLLVLEDADDTSSFNIEKDDDDDDDDDDGCSDDDDDDGDNIARTLRQDIPELKLKNLAINPLDANEQAWLSGIKRDPVKRARTVVRILRSSDQRKQEFKKVIKDGNKNDWFRGANSSVIQVPDLEPLLDVKTRWDSTYAMIERLVVLRPAIDFFFKIDMHGLSGLKLTDSDWDLLQGIGMVLQVPHRVQQAMSAESMPVLSSAVAIFEIFMSQWEELAVEFPKLGPWISVGLHWAKKYYNLMDNTDAYIVTMVLNPCIRLRWITEQWGYDYIKLARTTILDLMSEYRRKQTSSRTPPVAYRGAAPATPRKSSTLKRSSVFPNFSTHLGFESKMDDLFGGANVSHTGGSVEEEFERYVSGLPSPRETDILHFWEINRSEFPTLFAIALDYLPIQASSVPCERVFSSAKDTDTAKRNRISPMLMEMLQTLKFSLKKDRRSISFTDGWKTEKVEMMGAHNAADEELLAQLFTGDCQATTDALLKIFDDDEQIELDGDN